MRILKTHKQQSTKIIDGNAEMKIAFQFVKKKGQSKIHIGCSAHGYVESLQNVWGGGSRVEQYHNNN